MDEFQHLKIQLEEIKGATANFDDNNVIGKGGFGTVYKGVLPLKGQDTVAFKRLDRRHGQGDPEFLKEILMLSLHKHENLIALLGFCDEDDEKILVYEHASRGSLDHHLNSTTLTWRQRLKICLGAAMGLCYLHDPKETQQRVIHRDIKSSNILLDENWNAKVSDMGLSKIGPANQDYTFLVTNVVGTPGYVDPMYFEKSILTKESDIYSFGVVLFEVLCGKLCYEYHNGYFQSLVRMWKQSYKQKKLDDIIFQDVKEHIDPISLETYSDIAYQCLLKSREQRPKMSQVVEKLQIALRFQDSFEEVEPPMDYEEMSKAAVPRLVCTSEEELKMHLSKGIFVNGGKTWFLLDKNGKHCKMISAAECLFPIQTVNDAYYVEKKSRFAVDYHIPLCRKFKINIKTQFLSPRITYTVNLVFSFVDKKTEDDLDYNLYNHVCINYILTGETKSSTSYFVDKREDGWLMAELYQFTSDNRNIDLEITFQCGYAIAVDGIEFRPLERVEHDQVLEDDDEDMQSDTYWEQKLPSDYEDMIKWSEENPQWTTKKELYSILCKGFPIRKNSDSLWARPASSTTYFYWFSIAKNGKKCNMLPASLVLQKNEWHWRMSTASRFKEVAFRPRREFWINCIPGMLSPQTTYACYLVYKFQGNHSAFHEPPVKVRIVIFNSDKIISWHYTCLRSPQTPIIRPKVHQNTHNPLNRPKIEGLPRPRNDGWMEVHIWKCETTSNSNGQRLRLMIYDNSSIEGLIVEGIEFKPI